MRIGKNTNVENYFTAKFDLGKMFKSVQKLQLCSILHASA